MHCFEVAYEEKKEIKKRKYDTMAGGCCIKPDIYCMVSFMYCTVSSGSRRFL